MAQHCPHCAFTRRLRDFCKINVTMQTANVFIPCNVSRFRHTHVNKKKLTLKELQQLTGLLNFACQVIVPSRAFLRRLINLSIGLTKPYQHVRITEEAKNDLKSWLTFLHMFNGKVLFDYGPWTSSDCMHQFTDASGTKGFGAIFKPHWFYGKWPLDWHSRSISFLELYPIMASLCVWAEKLRNTNRRIILHTDNIALEAIINNSTSKNTAIMFLVRKIVCVHAV